MDAASFTEAMARSVLDTETSSTRFEDFCIELFRDVDGYPYVRTSRSWDLGRDGRDVSLRSGPVPPCICASLRGDHERKALADIQRLKEFIEPTHVLICFAAKVSENEVHGIEKAVRKLCPSIESIRTVGLDQLSQLSVRHNRALLMHYFGELQAIKSVLGYDDHKEEEIRLTGMRIALTTQLHDDAVKRRKDLIQNLILTALTGKRSFNPDGLSESISASLYLPRPINTSYFHSELTALQVNGFIDSEDGCYFLTDLGELEVKERSDSGFQKLAVGQQAVRVAIAQLTGHSLDSQEFKLAWTVFIDELANLFLVKGHFVIESVASIAEGRASSQTHLDLQNQIKKIGSRVASLDISATGQTGGMGNRITEISQAIVDLFTEKESAAFEWMESLCCTFIDICSLGLEPRAQTEVAIRLKEMELFLDTHVVLDLLAQGEPEHKAVVTVVRGWRAIGGRVYVSQSILEEAAYHAWTSTKEFYMCWRELAKSREEDTNHLTDNVFVRTFRKQAQGSISPRRWSNYIQGFRGAHKYDFHKLLNVLTDDYGIEFVAEHNIDPRLAENVTRQIIGDWLSKSPGEQDLTHRAKRDGNLVALLESRRKTLAGTSRSSAILSSSHSIRFGCSLAAAKLGPPDPVLSLGSVAWLLSLLPGAHFSLSSLRGILFDTGIAKRLPPIELQAMRVLEASEEYEMHWSRRGTLSQAIRERIGNYARQVGKPLEKVRDELAKPTEEAGKILIEIIAESVDQIALSKSEKRIQSLAAENDRLRRELEKLRRRV
jgi:hypothetical protein